jgi:type I restriction enzyme, S subunit
MPRATTRKTGWQTVTFGDIVKLSKERSSDAEVDGHERYIGLEHIDPGELRVRRWGNVVNGVTFTNVFRPGHVLFGKRRAYQRKVAVADFSGVCSGDIYVLEPKGEALLPELLPFICQSDAFCEHAIGTSEGSLSPRTSWKSLANFEFRLPPREEQERIHRVLSATEGVVHALVDAVAELLTVVDAYGNAIFGNPPTSTRRSADSLIDEGVLTLQTGPFGTVLRASSYTDAGHPVVNPVNIDDGRLDVSGGPFVPEDEWLRLSKYQMHRGDMIIGRKRHMSHLVFVSAEYEGFLIGSDLIRFRVDPKHIEPRYFFHFLRSACTQHWLQAQAGGNGSVMPGMNEAILGRLNVFLPELAQQRAVAARLDELEEARHRLLGRCQSAMILRQNWVNVLLDAPSA